MKRMAAVIHHGGIGTIACATATGVPQLILAHGADRPDNALRLQRLGVAEYLPPTAWRPGVLAEKLNELTGSLSVRECCSELAARIAVTDPVAAACRVIESAVRN
jgi:UDP:flavonoid glycosyltransferase YjiC (YdhE family)